MPGKIRKSVVQLEIPLVPAVGGMDLLAEDNLSIQTCSLGLCLIYEGETGPGTVAILLLTVCSTSPAVVHHHHRSKALYFTTLL